MRQGKSCLPFCLYHVKSECCGVKVIRGIVAQATESYEDFGITHYLKQLQNLIESIVSYLLMLSNKNIVIL